MILPELNVITFSGDSDFGHVQKETLGSHFADFGLGFGNPNFVKYAETYGVRGLRLQATEQMQALLSHCTNTPGVHVIEVPIDYTENSLVFTQELMEKSCII